MNPAAPRHRGPRRLLQRLLQSEALNFVLTNRVPRGLLTQAMGWFSALESPRLVRLSLRVWRLFTPLDLSEAEPAAYRSLREVFVRRLRPGARPVDARPELLVSPCDGLVGACGPVRAGDLWQAKGLHYRAAELFGDAARAAPFEGGVFVTLRLTSADYHRFHAPDDARLVHVTSIAGDVFNVNPPALARVPRLFCRNERAVLSLRLADGAPLALVPVAAILVASLRLHALDLTLRRHRRGVREWACSVPVQRGEELGWFEHGSTILVFAPAGFTLAEGVVPGARLRMGQPLLRRPQAAGAAARPAASGTDQPAAGAAAVPGP